MHWFNIGPPELGQVSHKNMLTLLSLELMIFQDIYTFSVICHWCNQLHQNIRKLILVGSFWNGLFLFLITVRAEQPMVPKRDKSMFMPANFYYKSLSETEVK